MLQESFRTLIILKYRLELKNYRSVATFFHPIFKLTLERIMKDFSRGPIGLVFMLMGHYSLWCRSVPRPAFPKGTVGKIGCSSKNMWGGNNT